MSSDEGEEDNQDVFWKAIGSGMVKAMQNEFVRVENVAAEMHDLAFHQISGNDASHDYFFFFLSFLFSQIKTSSIVEDLQKSNKGESWREYIKIRRNSAVFFLLLWNIFTKNIPPCF
jgi:hypothetical protein